MTRSPRTKGVGTSRANPNSIFSQPGRNRFVDQIVGLGGLRGHGVDGVLEELALLGAPLSCGYLTGPAPRPVATSGGVRDLMLRRLRTRHREVSDRGLRPPDPSKVSRV